MSREVEVATATIGMEPQRVCGVALEHVFIAAQVLYKKVLYKSWRVRLQSQLHLGGYTPNTYYSLDK